MTRALTKNGKVNKNSHVSIIIPCLRLVFKLQSFQTKICTILSTFQEHILSWLYLADLRRVVIRKVPEAVASSRKVRSFYFGHFFSQQLIKFSTNILGRPTGLAYQYGHEIIYNVVFSKLCRTFSLYCWNTHFTTHKVWLSWKLLNFVYCKNVFDFS